MAIKGGYNRKGLPKDKDGLPGKQKGNLPFPYQRTCTPTGQGRVHVCP